MNSSGQSQPPFFGTVPSMAPPQAVPTAPTFHPGIPPPNFTIPPPTPCMHHPGANFPRFSGPMHNQSIYNPAAMAGNMSAPPLPAMNPPQPQAVYNVPAPNFNHISMGQSQIPNNNVNNNNNHINNKIVNNGNQAYNNNQQRHLPCVTDNIFNDGPKDVPCGFPHFKPTMPPPPHANPSQFSSPQPQQGGFGRGGRGMGFQGNTSNTNNSFHHNNNSGGHNNSNNNRGRGGFRGGMNNRGRGNFHNNKGRGGNHNGGHQSGAPNPKRQKIDKRELPENNKFYCDTCDRGFKDDEKYKEHVDQHEKCAYKDCPFVAAPKLVQLHMNMQHRAGLANKIYGVKSEEDIKKWKEERKKNYPTADNIKKKKEKRQERIDRGEVIETKEFGKMKGQNQGRDRGRGRGRFGRDRGGGGPHSNGKDSKKAIEIEEDAEDDDGPPEERKIERHSKEEGVPIELSNGTDSEDQESCGQKPMNKKEIVDLTTKSPLKGESKKDGNNSSLVSGYESSSSDSDESSDGDGNKKIDKPKTTKKVEHTVFIDDDNDDGNKIVLKVGAKKSRPKQDAGVKNETTDANEVIATASKSQDMNVLKDNNRSGNTTKVNNSDSMVDQAIKRSHHHMTKGGPPNKKQKFTPKPLPKSYTLLEKLLAKEIRRERNKILQCVHFIVKNKFFDKIND